MLGGDHEITGECDLESAPHGKTVDGGDDRLFTCKPGRDAAKSRGWHRRIVALGLIFEIVAGAKGLVSLTCENSHPGLRVGFESIEYRFEFQAGRSVNCIAYLGSPDRDDPDAPSDLNAAMLHWLLG